ncbi:MAG: DUF2062 domain-containing protein [Nodosilinea sp.]
MRKRPQPRWQRQLRYVYWRFLRLQGSPEQLARGLASGVFAGCYPLFGFQIIIGVAVATLLRGNRIIAAAATWVSNPLTYVPIFTFNFYVGHWLLGGGPIQVFKDLDTLRGWQSMGTDVSLRLMLGSTVVGLVAGMASYYLGVVVIRRIRARRLQRLRPVMLTPPSDSDPTIDSL